MIEHDIQYVIAIAEMAANNTRKCEPPLIRDAAPVSVGGG